MARTKGSKNRVHRGGTDPVAVLQQRAKEAKGLQKELRGAEAIQSEATRKVDSIRSRLNQLVGGTAGAGALAAPEKKERAKRFEGNMALMDALRHVMPAGKPMAVQEIAEAINKPGIFQNENANMISAIGFRIKTDKSGEFSHGERGFYIYTPKQKKATAGAGAKARKGKKGRRGRKPNVEKKQEQGNQQTA